MLMVDVRRSCKALEVWLWQTSAHSSSHLVRSLLDVCGLHIALYPLGERNTRKPGARPERLWFLQRLELYQNFFPTHETLPCWSLGVKILTQNCQGGFSLPFLVTIGNCTRASCSWHYLSPSTSRPSIKTNLIETGRIRKKKRHSGQTFWVVPPSGSEVRWGEVSGFANNPGAISGLLPTHNGPCLAE